MLILLCLIGLLPSFLQRPLRNMLGANLAAGSSISIFSIILVRKLKMERGSRIGMGSFIKADHCELGQNAKIRGLSFFKVRRLELADNVIVDPLVLVNCDFGPRSQLRIGKHSRIFSFSVLEPSEGIFVGEQAGLGGQCLIFCHGSWPNYLDGAPYSRGPVHIGDQVWLPWRVMILPNTKIGAKAVIGAHSLVRGEVPSHSLFSGVPAKLILAEAWKNLGASEKNARLQEVITSFHQFHNEKYRNKLDIQAYTSANESGAGSSEKILYSFQALGAAELKSALHDRQVLIDFQGLQVAGQGPIATLFIEHLATYGVRLTQV